jgi:hypothetical protein
LTSFHVRHDFTPVHGREALLLLVNAPALGNDDLLQRARVRGLELGERRSPDKVVASLRDLGLASRSGHRATGPIELTPLGRELAVVAQRDPLLFGEFIHLRYWWLWAVHNPAAHFSWAYRTVTNLLWEEAPTTVDADRLVAAVLEAAEREFGVFGASFSPSSVLGILHWLRALSPPCLAGSDFQRRAACPPEAVVSALEGIQVTRGRPLDAPLRLDGAGRELACRATMLDDAALDDVLVLAEESLGLLRRSGDGGEVVVLRRSLIPGLVSVETMA